MVETDKINLWLDPQMLFTSLYMSNIKYITFMLVSIFSCDHMNKLQ